MQEGLWATWPAPCFSRGARGSGVGNNSRRSQTDAWPVARPPQPGAVLDAADALLLSSSGGSGGGGAAVGGLASAARGRGSRHNPQVLPLGQCTRLLSPQLQPPGRPHGSSLDASRSKPGRCPDKPGCPQGAADAAAGTPGLSGGRGPQGSAGDAASGQQGSPPQRVLPGLGGRCNSAAQLEGSGDDYREPCPGGLFSDGAMLFLRDLRSGDDDSGDGGAAVEDIYFTGYGGLMPEARSWADMWYAMFAGGTTTHELDALFGAVPPLNGFRPYRGGYVGVAGSPLPPSAAVQESRRRRQRAQQRLLPLVPRAPGRSPATQRALTPITRFGTTQYGTIAPAPDSAEVCACFW